MDKTDVILSQLLLANSRRSYRDLAEKLNLSVTAIHNRIQSLIEMGIIRKFIARPSVLAANSIHVFIYGASKTNSSNDLKMKLEKHGSIYWLAIGGGNFLYIGAHLKNIVELEALVSFIKEAAMMPEPTVGLTFSPLPPNIYSMIVDNKLFELDYQIIGALKDDSRKATADIAEELGVSAKTVRRRLTRLINNYLVELSIEWFPDASNDIISAFHVNLKPEADKNAVNIILGKYYPNTLFYWGFSNIPNRYLFLVWTPTIKELKDIRENFENEPAIQSVSPNVIYTGYLFKTWRDKIV